MFAFVFLTLRRLCSGSIHEGGELGYSLSHAYGAVLDKPDLTVACVIGDGEGKGDSLLLDFEIICDTIKDSLTYLSSHNRF